MTPLKHMGQSQYSSLFRKIDAQLLTIYRLLPTTYLGIIQNIFYPLLRGSKTSYEVLDLGCGDGNATGLLGLPSNFHLTGVELYDPYIVLAKKSGIYTSIIKHDARTFLKEKKYDVIIASHVIEHLTKNDGKKLVADIVHHANELVIIAMPIGEFPQDSYDSNSLQVHKSSWSVADFRNLDFQVKSQGVKFLWRNENIGLRYGLFSYIFFLTSFLLSPILWLKPEWGTYMICYRYL